MDVDYSPTGREFVSAGYDKVVRIFPVDKYHSRCLLFCLLEPQLNKSKSNEPHLWCNG